MKNKVVSFLAGMFLSFQSVRFGCSGKRMACFPQRPVPTRIGNPGPPCTVRPEGLSLARPGDTVVFFAGIYPCDEENAGRPSWIAGALRSAGDGKVVFSGDGSNSLLLPGSYHPSLESNST